MILYLSIFLNVCLFVAVIVLLYNVIKFGRIIIQVEDALEESLDTLDQQYNSISRILELPIFFDSPEVRQVLDDINRSRESILFVANVMAASIDEDSSENESE